MKAPQIENFLKDASVNYVHVFLLITNECKC